MSAIFIAWYTIFNVQKTCLCISNKGASVREIIDKIKVIYENLPFFLKPGVIKNDVYNMKFDNGCRLVAQSTTKKAGIGFTIHLLYLDEFAHIHPSFVNTFYENVYPTLSSSDISRIIITSTPNGFNKFHNIYDNAVKGLNEFTPTRVDWWEVPGRDEKWMKREVANLGSLKAFNEQYGNQFVSSDDVLLPPEVIMRLQKNMIDFIPHRFEVLDDIDLEYEKE